MKQRWWNSGTVKGEQWNRDGGRVKQRWWKSETVMVDEWNRYGGMVE